MRLGLVRVPCLDSLVFTVCTLIFMYFHLIFVSILSGLPPFSFSFSFSLKFCRVPVVTESRSLNNLGLFYSFYVVWPPGPVHK